MGSIWFYGGVTVSENTIDQLIEGLDAPQRENVLKALADAHVSPQDPFLAVMLAVSYKIQKQSVAVTGPIQKSGRGMQGILTGIFAGAAASLVCSLLLFGVSKSQADEAIARMATEIRENDQLLEDLRKSRGGIRYYSTTANGQPVRILTINGGQVKPTEAFITAAGAATIILPVIPKP